MIRAKIPCMNFRVNSLGAITIGGPQFRSSVDLDSDPERGRPPRYSADAFSNVIILPCAPAWRQNPNRGHPRRGVPKGTFRRQMHRAFPRKSYGQRAKIETMFSIVKRKLSSRAPGRSLGSQIRQALLLGPSYNLYRLRRCNSLPRMSPEPSKVLCLQQLQTIGAKSFRINRHSGYYAIKLSPVFVAVTDFGFRKSFRFRTYRKCSGRGQVPGPAI
jgi:hypothetical protein